MEPNQTIHHPNSVIPEDSSCAALQSSLGTQFRRLKTYPSEISRSAQLGYGPIIETAPGSVIKRQSEPIYAPKFSSSPSSLGNVHTRMTEHVGNRVVSRSQRQPLKRVNLDADAEIWSTTPARKPPRKKPGSATSSRVPMSGRFRLPLAVLDTGRASTGSIVSYKPPPRAARIDGDEQSAGKWHITMIGSNDILKDLSVGRQEVKGPNVKD